MKKNLLIICIAICYICQSQTVMINEFVSSNNIGLLDQEGENSDWIELYNAEDHAVNLEGYTLSDDMDDLTKWEFPEVIIEAKGYLIVFASGKDSDDIDELHTNFKIKMDGESLFLCNPFYEIIDQIDGISLSSDISYGRIPDGSDSFYVIEYPSPGQNNFLDSLVFSSHSAGFYSDSIYVDLFCNDTNSNIHYTLDGSVPDINSPVADHPIIIRDKYYTPNGISMIPTTPLTGPYHLNNFIWNEPVGNVFKSTILKYRIIKDSIPRGKITTRSFFVAPGQENKYTLPVISITADSLDLFGYHSGIMIPGKTLDDIPWTAWWYFGNCHQKGEYWERKATIEYFEPDGKKGFTTNCGIRMHGNTSPCLPQKSMRIYFRSEYGSNRTYHPIFKTNSLNSYKRLVIRNSGYDFLYTHFRDALLQELVNHLGFETQSCQPSIVFINGEYWGLYNIREHLDDKYLST